MKNKKVISIALLAFLLVVCSNGMASAFEGRGDLGIPGGSGGGGGNGQGDHKLVWTHYSFNGATGKAGQEIWLVPQYIGANGSIWIKGEEYKYSDTTDYNNKGAIRIDGECAQTGVGFWALTLATDTSYKVGSGYYDDNLSSAANGAYRNETQLTYLNSKRAYPARADSVNTYMSGNTYMIYRNAGKTGYSPYHTVSFNNASLKIHYGLTNNPQTLYYYDGSSMYSMYTSDAIASSQDDIYESYAIFYKKQYGVTISASESPTKMGGSDGTYAFCSFENSGPDPIPNTINSKTTLKIDGTTTSASSDWNTAVTNNTAYESNTDKIKLTTIFEYNREGSDTTVAVTFNKAESTPVTSASAGMKSFDVGLEDGVESDYVSEEYTIPNDGATHTICSETTHSHNVEIDEDGNVTEKDTEDSEACVKVKYVPLIANEINSKTSAVVSVSGVSTSGVSGTDNGDVGDPGIDMDVPYGEDITVNWKHSLGIKRVEKDDGNHVALNPLMGKFRVKYAKLGESWATSGLSKELSNGTYNSGLDNFNVDNLYETDKVKLLPGDRKELLRGITHPQTVKNDSAATSTGNESSSLKVTLTADTVKCAINGKDIGVNNSDNYAKMSLSVSTPYKSRTVGDGVDDSGNPYPSSSTVWLKGNDKIKKFSYSICDGAQIAKDRAWLDSNSSVTDWTSASVTDLDEFEVSMNPLNDSLNGRLYNTNSNGLTPATSIKLSGVKGKNIRADEIGDNEYLQARVDAGYQLKDQDTVAATEASYQLGQTIEHGISFQTSNNDTTVKKYSITTKVPYNYIIDPGFDQFDGSSIYYGEDISAVSNVKTKGRVNEDTGATATDAPTLTKTSKYYTAIFTLGADKNLKYLLDNISASGATRMKDSFGNETRDFYIQSDEEFESILNDRIDGTVVSSTTEKDGTATTKVGEGVEVSIGTKYCAVAAVWPADSHNDMNITGDSVIASGNPQTNALIGDNPGTGAYWRFEISCRTLGKKPTVSVEGSGIISGGGVITSTTNYGGNIFGSWSEYGLIADNSTSVNFGTGASLAYHGPQLFVNEQADPSEAGLDKDAKCIGIETVGNINCSNQVGLDTNEARSYASRAIAIKNRIIAKNGTVKHNGNLVIDNNVYKNADGSTPIIYADNIKIHPDVTEINAILIADGNLDTCYLESDQNGTTQGATKGNSGLKDNCDTKLVVNGAVFADSITLDRVYGGGSYGDSVTPRSLVQRAEIFNFDPAYVSEVYKQSMEDDPITTTYIKELPSRY